MRPERLVLEGFGSFKEATVVDFTGVDLFALSGPTGSGKSTLIDAIVFALYGCVPRFADRRVVAPVLSPGKVEARVCLDFSVAGEPYTAVRVVRAASRGSGATTREARLEHRGEVLAGSADELTDQVTKLLGLSFEHFTTCVVLPQGEFQRFLHSKPSDRQELLVKLLDLGVYRRMASLARARATAATGQAEWCRKELADLAFATAEEREAHEARVGALNALLEELDRAAPRLTELDNAASLLWSQHSDAIECVSMLAGLSVPEDVAELASDRERASAALVEAEQAEEQVTAAVEAADAALRQLSPRHEIEAVLRCHQDRNEQAARLPKGEAKLDEDRAAEDAAVNRVDETRRAHEEAVAALEAAQVADRARALAVELSVGDPCPVCGQTVHELPAHDAADLDAARQRVAAARQALDDAEAALQKARAARERDEALLDEIRSRVASLDTELANLPDEPSAHALLAEITEAERVLAELRQAEREARDARRLAAEARRQADEREQSARQEFESARDRVALLEPPAPARRSLLDDWTQLVAWAASQKTAYEQKAAELQEKAEAAEAERDAVRRALAARCKAAGVPVGPTSNFRDDVVAARAEAEADLASIESAIARAEELRDKLAQFEQDKALFSTLANHLGASGFEKWVLDEALERLVAGATEILYDLSGGAFSLTIEPRIGGFQVIDHANADTVRLARTLSGGETFLASLALALSLADQVAEMAAGGAARLESIFLDEGFGTLDPDTLGVVASAIEELGSRGRMVGIVSHVRELAEAIPVRYDVTKGPHTSTVVRVDQ